MTLDKLLEICYTAGYDDGFEDAACGGMNVSSHDQIKWSYQSFLSDLKNKEEYKNASNQFSGKG